MAGSSEQVEEFETDRYPAIKEAMAWSNKVITDLNREIGKLATSGGLDQSKVCAIVFGSLARGDASQVSDVDFTIVHDGASEEMANRLKENVLEAITLLDLEPPNPDGTFDKVVSISDILDHVGSKKDSYDLLTSRVLLLLEARVLWGDRAFSDLQERLISFYEADVALDSSKNHVFLLNDLVRYFRTLCVNYAYTKQKNPEKWAIRNVKLRHSRVIMYASMIAALGALSKSKSKAQELRVWVARSPLERLYFAYEDVHDPGFYKIAGLYNTFLTLMNDEKVRSSLAGLKYEERYSEPYFAVLKSNSDALSSEIARFMYARRGQWSDRFLEYLII